MSVSWRFSGFFPIRRGPKSNTPSEVINAFDIYDSGGLSGLFFFEIDVSCRNLWKI